MGPQRESLDGLPGWAKALLTAPITVMCAYLLWYQVGEARAADRAILDKVSAHASEWSMGQRDTLRMLRALCINVATTEQEFYNCENPEFASREYGTTTTPLRRRAEPREPRPTPLFEPADSVR